MRAALIVLAAVLQLGLAGAHAREAARDEAAGQKETDAVELPTVEVTAEEKAFGPAGARREAALTPGAVTVVEGDILDDRNIASLADMMRYVPGLYIASDAGSNEVFFSARGSNLDAIDYDMNGILLLQNGIPITAPDGTNHNRLVAPLSARYAVVALGANGIKYGASTLGGAINFVSPTAYDIGPAILHLSGGSHGLALGRLTVSRVFDNGLDGLVTLAAKQHTGYIQHTEQHRVAAYANVGWRISEAVETRIYLTRLDENLELGGGLSRAQFRADPYQAGTDALKGDFQRNVEATRIAGKTTWRLGPHQHLSVGLAYEEQELYHPIVADFGGDNPFFDGLLIDTTLEYVAASARYEHKIGDHNLLVGANYRVGGDEGRQYGNNHGEPGDLQTLVDQAAETLTIYFMDRWHVGQHWVVVPGLQYIDAGREINNTTITNPTPAYLPARIPGHIEGRYSAVNPRIGVIYQGDGFELFANLSSLYEPPTNFALDDPTTGAPDDVLSAMEGTVVEVGTRGEQSLGSGNYWKWSLTAYYAWIDNEILSVKNPHPTSPANRFVTSNADDTVHAGIGAVVRAHLALGDDGVHAIEPVVALTVNHFRFDNSPVYGDNELPAAPDYVLRGEILYRNANGFYIGPTFDVVGDRFADFANTYRVDSYAVVGLLTGWSNEDLSVYFEIENVTDEVFVATHSVMANAGPSATILRAGAPLSVFAGMEYRW